MGRTLGRRTHKLQIASLCAFALLFAVLMHRSFSHLGFSPTDEGLIFAMSERILSGQVPHGDFVFTRPAGSPLLHVLTLLLGGEQPFLFSRFVFWVQISLISLLWVFIWSSNLRTLTLLSQLSIFVIGAVMAAHTFPAMIWYTVDAITAASLAVFFLQRRGQYFLQILGALVLGLAPVFKQNFGLLIVLPLIIFPNRVGLLLVVIASLPALLYMASLAWLSCFKDFVIQITAQTNLRHALSFFVDGQAGFFMLAFAILPLWIFVSKSQNTKAVLELGFMGVLCLSFYSLLRGSFPSVGSWLLFYSLSYMLLSFPDSRRLGIISCLIACCTSISLGYPWPALGITPLVIGAAYAVVSKNGRLLVGLPILAVLAMATFAFGRYQHIYRQPSHTFLTHSLGEVFPAARGIYTDPKTFRVFAELQVLSSGNYRDIKTLIPDFPAFWVQYDLPNALPIDWPWPPDFPGLKLQLRVIDSLKRILIGEVILVQRFDADKLFELPNILPACNEIKSPALATLWDGIENNFELTYQGEFFCVFTKNN